MNHALDAAITTFPVQTVYSRERKSRLRKEVVLAAYEVYCHVFGPQQALVEGDCRGGFSTGELIVLLYAKSFPKAEWRERVTEALKGMEHL